MENLIGEITLDKKRRLALGRVLKGRKISSFDIYQTDAGYLLKPKVSIPAEELWIFENTEARKRLSRGLRQEAKHDPGSFKKYLESE